MAQQRSGAVVQTFYQPCRQVLADRGMIGQITTRGVPAPIQAGRRWVIQRTHA